MQQAEQMAAGLLWQFFILHVVSPHPLPMPGVSGLSTFISFPAKGELAAESSLLHCSNPVLYSHDIKIRRVRCGCATTDFWSLRLYKSYVLHPWLATTRLYESTARSMEQHTALVPGCTDFTLHVESSGGPQQRSSNTSDSCLVSSYIFHCNFPSWTQTGVSFCIPGTREALKLGATFKQYR